LALEVDTSFASRRVTRALDAIVADARANRRRSAATTGPGADQPAFSAWCVERAIELIHIQPGKPAQNARVESSTDDAG